MTTTNDKPKFCRSCGDKKQIRYPKSHPKYCSAKCVVWSYERLVGLGYCTKCGSDVGPDNSCLKGCDDDY